MCKKLGLKPYGSLSNQEHNTRLAISFEPGCFYLCPLWNV